MKKFFIVLTLIVATAFSANAQFVDFGFRAGTGLAYHSDDLANNGPVAAFNVGGFVNYGFTSSESMLAEILTIQTGLNLIHRGSTFEEVLEDILSVRQGKYSAWYVQLPILASFRMELPVREPGHFGLLTVGPAVSYGLFGTMDDLIFTHGYPQYDWNHKISGSPVFDYLNRLDVSFQLGVGYEWQDLSIMLHLDYGMTSVCDFEDALKNDAEYGQGNTTAANAIVPMGNNCAFLLTLGYKFPVR